MSRASAEAKTGPVNIRVDIVRALNRKLSAVLTGFGSRLHGYLPAIAAVGTAFLIHHALVALYGPRIPGLWSLYILAFLIAAWCGYGPGLLATPLIVIGVPYQFRANFSLDKVDFSALAIYMLLSVVVSAKAAGRRKAEAALTNLNAELDSRVRQQTAALAEVNITLQNQLAELETLYGKLSVGLCFLDQNLQFVRVNEKFASISGVAVQDHLNRDLRDVMNPKLADVLERLCKRLLASDEPVVEHEVSVPVEGRVQYWAVNCSPVQSPSGVLGLQLAMQDITGRKQAEHELNEANADLRRANEDLEQFAYSASHDLQEPIRTVAIYSQMLKRKYQGALGKDGDDYIGYTLGGALRMEQLVKDLLAYTQASAPVSGPAEVVSSGDALKQALSNLTAAVAESGVQVVYGDLPDVRVRRTLLVQLLQNLVGNALKYRRQDAPRVEIGARPDGGGRWLFWVSDNGIGIDPKYQEQIFGLFKRLHVAAEYPGTGIGLAICRRIVERHGGRIWVESKLGEGATFYLTLPEAALDSRQGS